MTLINNKQEEFKVNGQRLKHYLGEKQLEDKPLVLNEKKIEEIEQWQQTVQLKTQNRATHGRQPIQCLNS